MNVAHDDSTMQESTISFRGTTVGLGPLTHEMIPLFHQWLNDPEHSVLANNPFVPATREQAEQSMERRLKEPNPQEVWFGIFALETAKPIGLCVLRHIAQTEGLAEFGIAIIDKAYWGKGYGTEATYLTMDFAFNGLGLHNVILIVAAYNERAIKVYQKVGFRIIGRRREARKLGATRYDLVMMDCLASDFTSPLPPIVPPPQ